MARDTSVVEKSPSVKRDKCGTYSGYGAHVHYGEITCQPCRDAQAAYSSEYRRKNPERWKVSYTKASVVSKDKKKIYDSEKRKKNPAKVRSYYRRWAFANATYLAEYKREYRLRNAEKIKVRDALTRKSNPEKGKIKGRTRRARKAGAVSEPYTVQDILDLHGTDCHLCGDFIDLDAPRHPSREGWQLGLHLDHVIPLSAGGNDLKTNVKPSHALCNLRKRNHVN